MYMYQRKKNSAIIYLVSFNRYFTFRSLDEKENPLFYVEKDVLCDNLRYSRIEKESERRYVTYIRVSA